MRLTGWLNRALESLPPGDRVATPGGLAVGPSTPLVIRGAAPVVGWAPQSLPEPGAALQKGLDADRMAVDDKMGKTMKPKGGLDSAAGMRQAAKGAARLIAADDGPRVAALAFDGWDTHVNEGGATGRLATLLGGLDGAFEEFERAWASAGRTRRSSPSPSSDARRRSTAPSAPIMAPAPWCCWLAARSRVVASSPTGRD